MANLRGSESMPKAAAPPMVELVAADALVAPPEMETVEVNFHTDVKFPGASSATRWSGSSCACAWKSRPKRLWRNRSCGIHEAGRRAAAPSIFTVRVLAPDFDEETRVWGAHHYGAPRSHSDPAVFCSGRRTGARSALPSTSSTRRLRAASGLRRR